MIQYRKEDIEKYQQMLRNTGALSRLFSENSAPFLVSRSTENIYCDAFGAENLGRSDCTADAKYENIGIGIKTFLHGNGRTLQKIAEFNRHSSEYEKKEPTELIRVVSELRNKRINFTLSTYGLTSMIYHCTTRSKGMIHVYEEPMNLIDIDNIKNIKKKQTTIEFEDGIHNYSFNTTKSTLYKRFKLENKTPIFQIKVTILANPYKILEGIDFSAATSLFEKEKEFVVLPLFSDVGKRNVPERSGLNQWNANGRVRSENEVYIPIPAWIHTKFKNFFPARDKIFKLILPDGEILSTKVCQEGRKALMSNPNSAIGVWLLRKVFNLKPRELLTYQLLVDLNMDSVKVTKLDEDTYEIDFCELGTYDNFKEMK